MKCYTRSIFKELARTSFVVARRGKYPFIPVPTKTQKPREFLYIMNSYIRNPELFYLGNDYKMNTPGTEVEYMNAVISGLKNK